MITYVKTDLFESPAQVLVNTVNTVGVMGKGIAKNFKEIYPDMFKEYQSLCERKLLDTGKLWIYKTPHKWILNFPTKRHWRQPSKLEYIEEGLKKFVSTYAEKGISSISFPLLGCGNGGLDWESEVQPLMEKYLRPLPIDIFIHLPTGKNKISKEEHKNIDETRKWLRSAPLSLSFYEVWDDLTSLFKNEPLRFQTSEGPVSVNIINDPEPTLFFIFEGSIQLVSQDQLMDFWKYLRTVGFCMRQGLPYNLIDLTEPLFKLFAMLPYIEPVSMSHRFTSDEDFQIGIRLLPYLAAEKEKIGSEDITHELEE